MIKRIIFFFLLFPIFSIVGQTKDLNDVSIDALMNETQFSSDNPDKMEMIWYVPSKFWEISMSQDPTMSEKDAQDIIDLIDGFELIAVVQGDIGSFGGISYTPVDKIRSDMEVIYAGKKLDLVDSKNYSPDLSIFLSIMKPMMVNMLGPMGENMHFFVFESSEKNLLPVDLLGQEDFRISIDGYTAELDLPLNCLLKEKICPVDGDSHSGKWNYCPMHGKKLLLE